MVIASKTHSIGARRQGRRHRFVSRPLENFEQSPYSLRTQPLAKRHRHIAGQHVDIVFPRPLQTTTPSSLTESKIFRAPCQRSLEMSTGVRSLESVPGTPEAAVQNVEWNLAKVRAPEAWAKGFTGQGIVVENIDTGVQFDHAALVNQYRVNLGAGFDHNYTWWDATGTCTTVPCDDNNHGTHTMGIMVGSERGRQSDRRGARSGLDCLQGGCTEPAPPCFSIFLNVPSAAMV